jgi:hypothetical protein
MLLHVTLRIVDATKANEYYADLPLFVQKGQINYLVRAKLASSRLGTRAAAVEPRSTFSNLSFKQRMLYSC